MHAICDSDASVVVSHAAAVLDVGWKNGIGDREGVAGRVRIAPGLAPIEAPVVTGIGAHAPVRVSALAPDGDAWAFHAEWGRTAEGYTPAPVWKDETDFRVQSDIACADGGDARRKTVVSESHLRLCGQNVGYYWVPGGSWCCILPPISVP